MVLKLEGMDELLRALNKKKVAGPKLKQVVMRNGTKLHQAAQRKAVFKGHYAWVKGKGRIFVKPTGNLRRNIRLRIEDGGYTAKVRAGAEYSGYVELGTRYMAAQPYLQPALNEIEGQFKGDLEALIYD